MRIIKLTQDKEMLVDDEDYDILMENKCQYHHMGYAVTSKKINGEYKQFQVHRLILKLTTKDKAVDHINGNKLDNRKQNLRLATTQENGMNRAKHKKFTSEYKGVGWSKARNKWRATIYFNYKAIYIGIFNNEEDAAKAYNEKANELFGKFAKLNEVQTKWLKN